MPKLRLAIKKEGALQFLSHLDFARAIRYVIIRAKLPVCYSEGFNPHMKINFASALGVGVSAAVEYMDLDLQEAIPCEEVLRRMNAQAPDGFAVLDGKYIPEKSAKLMALANFSRYTLSGPLHHSITDDELLRLLEQFNDAATVIYKKISPKSHKSKIIDMKKHIARPVTGHIDHDMLFLDVSILQTEEGSIKPLQLWSVLAENYGFPIYADLMLAHRLAVYHSRDGVCSSLFDAALWQE